MPLQSSSPSRRRAALLPAAFLFSSLFAAASAGCDTTLPCDDCNLGGQGGEGGSGGAGGSTSSNGGGGSGGGACTSSQGTLEGTAYRFEGPPNGEIAAGASVVILSAPGATPLYGETDEAGHFSIPLDAGEWIIGGEDTTGCQTYMPVTIQLDPCEVETLDLVLDICTG